MPRLLALLNSFTAIFLLAAAALAQTQAGATASPAKAPALQAAPQPGTTVIQAPAPAPVFFTGEAKVSSKVDKTVISVGEIINYSMEVEIPEGYGAAIPPPGAQLGEFLIRKYDFPPAKKKGGRLVQQFNFQITAYTTGESSIPPVPVIIAKDKTPVRAVLAEEIRIRVAPVTGEAEMEIKDVKAPVEAPYNYKPLLIAGIILFSIIALRCTAPRQRQARRLAIRSPTVW